MAEHKTKREPLLLSIKDAARLIGLSPWTLRDLIRACRVRAVKPPGVRRTFIDRRDLDIVIEEWKS